MTLTKDEEAFFSRVAAHVVETGMDITAPGTMETACRAVLARDEQLWLEVATGTKVGKAIAETMAKTVYTRIRATT